MKRTRWRRLLAAAAFASAPTFAHPLAAAADPQVFPVGASPVVVVQGQNAAVTIHTWNRQQIEVDSDGAAAQYVPASVVGSRVPTQIPVWAESGETPRGPVSLPPESFLLPSMQSRSHDAVTVRGDGTTTITVPQNTALVIARVGHGSISMDGYRGGTFVTFLRNGQLRLNGVAGTGFVQVLHGRMVAQNSSFDRVRVRSLTANLVFSNCDAHQIQATSVNGSILYDNGSFQPGLARFESQRGNVAVGIGNGSASFGAHSAEGRVFNTYDGRDGSAPVVTATSQSGNVLLYRGSARDNAALASQWPQSRGMLMRAQRPELPQYEQPHAVPPGNAYPEQQPGYRPPVERAPYQGSPPEYQAHPPAYEPHPPTYQPHPPSNQPHPPAQHAPPPPPPRPPHASRRPPV